MTQPDLFPACSRGQHGKPIYGDPIDYGDCVNIPHFCPNCGVKLSETSWTKEAFIKRAAKKRATA